MRIGMLSALLACTGLVLRSNVMPAAVSLSRSGAAVRCSAAVADMDGLLQTLKAAADTKTEDPDRSDAAKQPSNPRLGRPEKERPTCSIARPSIPFSHVAAQWCCISGGAHGRRCSSVRCAATSPRQRVDTHSSEAQWRSCST